ncbi:anti-sigma factor [Variovorax dokdonensis]|uniref:Anti-sigma factor n=1 Tax=Variovorax dokdonensis TaxID=344883 RepID=A0ABT7NE92_9BURK|nr:anti-sigma factor [Variovorax dokdonensis]MDM0046264.1 anti-sigma factor [Variovorax dokdonensis]
MDLSTPQDRDAAAAEFVLGTLNAEERAGFSAAMAQDRALQAAVYAWQDRLLPLSARVAPAQPDAVLWQRIEVALEGASMPAARARPRQGPWSRLRLWQGLSAACLAMAVALGTVLLQQPDMPAGPRYVAVLNSPDGTNAGWVVELDQDRLRLVPTGETPPVPSGRSLQFWTKAQGAAQPSSLGLVQAGQTVEMPVSRLPSVGPQQLFEITLEPEGGSTIGRPTGPILFVGRSVAL